MTGDASLERLKFFQDHGVAHFLKPSSIKDIRIATKKILLLKKAIKDNSSIGEVNIQVCNDIDSHFHEIRNMIYSHLLRDLPLLEKEDIVQTKFPKTSLVDVSARNLREKNIDNAKNYVILKINIDELSKIIKK